MYKLISGIIAVGVLQFALTTYLRVQEHEEKSVAKLRPAVSRTVQRDEPSPAAEISSDIEAESVEAPESSINYRQATSSNSRKSRRSTAEKNTKQTAPRPEFDNVVISYDVPPAQQDCRSPNKTKPKRKESTQFAAVAPRWKVVKTEALSFE